MQLGTEQKLTGFQGQTTALRCYQKVNDSLKLTSFSGERT